MPSTGDVTPPRKSSVTSTRSRGMLPVVAWLQAGAVAGAMGLALVGAPAAAADESGSSVSTRSSDDAQSPTRVRRSPQPAPVTGAARGPNSAGPATAVEPAESPRRQGGSRRNSTAQAPVQQDSEIPAVGNDNGTDHENAVRIAAPPMDVPAGPRPSAAVRVAPIEAVPSAATPTGQSAAVGNAAPEVSLGTASLRATPAPAPAVSPASAALPQASAPAAKSVAPVAKAVSVPATPSGSLAAGAQNLFAALSDLLPAGQFNNFLAGALLLARRDGLGDTVAAPSEAVTTTSQTTPAQAVTDPSIRLAILGDAGNSYTNGTNYYYAPGAYRRSNLGASGPMQQAVADMIRGWNPTEVVQLGDESYNVASSTLLDYNIGQYYNNWIAPYVPPAFTQPGSIYTDGTKGGVQAEPGKTQWPYNIYNFPNGFPNPTDPTKPGGSPDGVNHYWAVPGNHDEATILGSYNDASVNQVNYNQQYNGKPIGPDAWDYQNNIIKNPPYPQNGTVIPSKDGSTQSLLDYHAYLNDPNAAGLKPGTVNIGKLDPNGYGIYYGVNLGDAGDGRPLIHLTVIDTSRLLTDAGYYDFNYAPNEKNQVIDPVTGEKTADRKENLFYDVRQPLTAANAWFQGDRKPTDPSIGREMFLWAKKDLENSDAVWNVVMGHHPAYHAGSPRQSAEKSYTSNAVILNFLQGLKDDTDAPLFDAYMNGHSHAYARVQEMTPSADGIGEGIPFLTIGDSGKSLDGLNLAPYGTSVIEPLNYFNLIGANADATPKYNYDINGYLDPGKKPSETEAASLAPYKSASPTSVGLSGFYSYSKYNWPVGTGYDPKGDPSKLTVTSVTTDPNTGVAKKFSLTQPTYLSLLNPKQGDLSGLYGFGSGAAQLDASDSYMMVHYKTAQPIDPAIALIGRGQGVTSFDPSSLFYKQWSPSSAKQADLAMFSFDVDKNGSVTNVQLVNRGDGYFESDPAASSYLTTTQNFEILGNNPANPLGFNSSDPTRAVVALTFDGGKLTAANLVNPGSGYQQVANAILQNNDPSTVVDSKGKPVYPNGTVSYTAGVNNSLLVGVNIDLQGQYTLAASRPAGTDPYHDWYMMTDTGVGSGTTSATGAFGAVDLALQPRSQKARQLIADTPLTTGYSGKGAQQKYLAPQAGTLSLVDSLGQDVGTATVTGGIAKVTLSQLPAPGPLRIKYSGDATSSYQVNYRRIGLADNVQVGLNYGNWTGPVAQQGTQLQFSAPETVQVTRSDSGGGLATFSLTNGSTSKLLAFWALGARPGALQAKDLFGTDPSTNWQSTESKSLGGAGSARVGAGDWTPTARLNGCELKLESLQLTSNGALARFAAGDPNDPNDDVLATYTLPSTGKTTSTQKGVLTVRRLSGRADGLALYEADPVTGAVVDSKGKTFKPGQIGYLNAALDNAKQLGLVIKPEDMPEFGKTAERTDLPLDLNRNYGTLLMVNGSESNMLSSYSKANVFGTNQALSLVAPDRGVSYGFEDKRPWEWGADRDYNDVIVTLTPAAPTLTL